MICWAHLYLLRLEKTGENKYKAAADIFRGQLNSHPRTAQGQFWHKLRYPNQGQVHSAQGFILSRWQYTDAGWLDGIYMGEVFYADYTKQLQPGNTTAWGMWFELAF